MAQENRLFHALLGDSYNKALRPVLKGSSTAVLVKLGMALIHINDVVSCTTSILCQVLRYLTKEVSCVTDSIGIVTTLPALCSQS